MLARAKRNSERTIALLLCVVVEGLFSVLLLCVVVEGLFTVHPCKNGDKHITTNYRSIFYYPLSPKFIQNLILGTPIKTWQALLSLVEFGQKYQALYVKTYASYIIADEIKLPLKCSFWGKWYLAVRITEKI